MTIVRRIALVAALVAAPLAGCGQRPAEDAPASGDTLRIYLARHGQTDWNAARRLQGQTDVPINETGKEQARRLSRILEGAAIDRIFCSALRRSRETAEIVSDGRIPVEAVPGLNEQRLGKFEGVYLDGRDPQIAAEYERRSADPEDSLDGGESRSAHHARSRAALEEILRRHEGGSILIVGHGGTNSGILGTLLNLTVEKASAIRQSNDEVYLIEVSPGREARLWKRIAKDRLEELQAR